jgi:alpha-galactosidase
MPGGSLKEDPMSITTIHSSGPDPGPGMSRRDFCSRAVAATGLSAFGSLSASQKSHAQGTPDTHHTHSFMDILRRPDLVVVFTPDERIELTSNGTDTWEGKGVEVSAPILTGTIPITLRSPGNRLCRLLLRWRGDLRKYKLFLGDHWERSYADLSWEGERPNRSMPWYVLAHDGTSTDGYGVRTQPNAFCFWNADAAGISLWADVRNGGSGVELGERALHVCDVVCRQGGAGESPFEAAVALCKVMCPKPLLPRTPVIGTNDWYYVYGKSDPEEILKVTEMIVGLAPKGPVRPFSVVDAGWSPGRIDRGPWDRGNEKFPSMAGFAARIREAGAEPGVWIRPLAAAPDAPEQWRLSRDKRYLDPTIPEVVDLIRSDIRRFREWGYGMIKHDFTSFDVMGRWGFDMGALITHDGWSFRDRTRTTAEIINALYNTIREAATGAVVIGCNTFSHLSAGVFGLNRIGDDTSGRIWNRTRRMGVNTLAFRAAQHQTFYSADPDCVPITKDVPWDQTTKWLDLVAASGMPLLVSPQRDATGTEQREALARAFATAASLPPTAEPLDWLETSIPRRWKLQGRNVEFDWMEPAGPWPFGD